jgi:hypothetical protein
MAAAQQQATDWHGATEKTSPFGFYISWYEMENGELWWVSATDVEQDLTGEVGFRASYVQGQHVGNYIVLDPDGCPVDTINVRNADDPDDLRQFVLDTLDSYQNHN